MTMRIVLTAGGTREPIDDVRVVANSSSGRLGARIAEAAVAAGHEVVVLAARSGCARPEANVSLHAFDTSADLAALLAEHVPGADAVVHAAAVSDFVPERAAGKLSSDADELVLRMRRAPKLVDDLRALAPDATLVGFKLQSGGDEAALVAAAGRLLARARLDLVVANDAAATGDDDHRALFVGPDGVQQRATGKRAVAAALVDWIGRRARREVGAR